MSQASIVSAHAENDIVGFPPSSQAAASLYEAPPPHPPVVATAEVTRTQSTSTAANKSESPNASTPIPTPVPSTTATTIKNTNNTEHHDDRPVAGNTQIQPRPSDSTTTFKPPTMEPSLSMLSEAPTEVDPEDHASSLLRMRQEATPPSSIPTQTSQLEKQQQQQQQSQRLEQEQQPSTTQVPVSAAPTPLVNEASRVEAQGASEKASKNVVTPPNIQQTPESPGGTVGSKRTATGTLKGLSSSMPNTPQLSGKLNTDKTRIVELSSTLKTRLSYAMLKVQQGWQTDTIDQVEEKYAHVRHIGLSRSPSMNMSPGSAQSDPQTRTGGLKREYSGEGITQDQQHHPGLNESQISQVTEVAPEYDRGHQRHHSEQHHHHPPPGLTPQSSFSSSVGGGERTYESFWREHTSNPHTAKILAARGSSYTSPPNIHATLPPLDPHSARGLAPAAPIVQQRPLSREHHPDSFAARRRRVHPPPSLVQNASNISTMSNFSTASTEFPITPTRPTTLTMEQDAVESLMFLSSPGHSQKAPSSQPSSQQQQQQPHHLQHQRTLPSQVQAQSNLIRRVWASTGPGSVGAETDDDGDSFMGDANAPISEDDLDRELDNDDLHRHEEDEDDDDDEEDVYAYRAGQQQQQQQMKPAGVGMGIPRRDDRGAEASAQIHEHRIKRIKKTIENVSAANRVKQAEQNRIMAAAAAAAATGGGGETTGGSVPPGPPVMAGDRTDTRAVRPVS